MLLVFGAGGQLGRELCELAGHRKIPAVGFRHADVDAANADQVAASLSRWRPDVVVNAAAYTAVDRAESEPLLAERGNVAAPVVLAKACAKAGAAMIHISTDYVFDGSKKGSYVEDDPIAPLGVYGRSKAEGERRLRALWDRHIILRTSWLYGIYGSNFLKTILRLAGEQDEIKVVDDQIGCPTGTADLAAAILKVTEFIRSGREPWGTYHFAGTGAVSWYGFAKEIVRDQAELTGRYPKVLAIGSDEYPVSARRPSNSEFDSSKFANAFGFRAAPWRERTAAVVKCLCEKAGDGEGA